MRETDFQVNLRPDGSMAFRTLVPTGKALWEFKPAAASARLGTRSVPVLVEKPGAAVFDPPVTIKAGETPIVTV